MTNPPTAGRVTVALTGPAEIAKDRLKVHFTDTEGQNLMRLGLAYAVRCGLTPDRSASFGRPGDGQTAGIGSFDPSGEIRALIQALYPDGGDPYAIAETLMSRGIIQLDVDVAMGKVTTLADLMYEREPR